MSKPMGSMCLVFLVLNLLQQPTVSSYFQMSQIAFKSMSKIIEVMLEVQKSKDIDGLEALQEETSTKLKSLSTDFTDLKDVILENISNRLLDKLTEKTDILFKYAKDVQRLYKKFLNYFENPDCYQWEKKEFAAVSTSPSLKELRATVDKMHEVLIDRDVRKDSIISIIAKDSTASDTMCIQGKSSQQFLYDLYNMVALTDAKGLIVTLYAYGLKESYENTTFECSKNDEKNEYLSRVDNTFNKVKEAMAIASSEIWACDPEKHVKNVTYMKLQETFQGFFAYQSDMTRNNFRIILDRCEDFKNERLRCRTDHCFAQPKDRRCAGILRGCITIADYMQICHSPPGSDRRYDWMKTGDGVLYGHDGYCENTQGLASTFFIHDCLCNCENEGRETDRYFSLLPTSSDIKKNKVVTGVRLTKRGNVFYVQVQQGKLAGNASINGEVEWKEVKEIPQSELLSEKVSKYNFVATSRSDENDDHELKYEEWVEFFKNDLVYPVTYDQRVIYLDDFKGNTNELVTGFRFKQVGKDLRLEVRVTPFDFSTGTLNRPGSVWICNTNTTKKRTEVVLTEPNDPTREKSSNQHSSNNQYVRFVMSDLSRDLSQSTVPFLDKQDVTTKPPLPISGAGLYHKGRPGSGGFLGLKLFHFDFTPFL